MKRIKKSLSILLALMLCLSLFSVGALSADADPFADVAGKLVILHTNDVHGRDFSNASQYGTAAVAQLKKDYEDAGAYVLLLSAGDAIQGTTLVNYDQGATAIEYLSAAGYDAMSPGNHEFDYGAQNLFDILKGSSFKTLSANINFTEGNTFGGTAGELVFNANEIFEFDGLKVGVFGLTTPEAMTKAHPDKIKGITFLQGKEMFDAAQAQVDFLTGKGCDLIICLGHLGIDDESTGNRSIDLIAAVDGIDLFVDGHSHTVLADGRDVGGTLLVQAGTALANIGVVVFDSKAGTLDASLLGIAGGEKAYDGIDEELDAKISERNTLITTTLKAEVIGNTEILLYGKNTTEPPGVRMSETNLGDFATDALLWLANKTYGDGFADAALTNGGGIRDSIPGPEITMFDMLTVFPFGNVVEIVEVTGAQLLEALEAATFSTPAVVGAFPQVAGIEFSIHTYIPYEQGDQYPGSTYYAPAAPGSRIKDVKVGGKPLDLEKTYKIATNDFTAAGGDTYLVFRNKLNSYATGVAMEKALIDYLSEELGGGVGKQYAKPQGRI
ncbi:MAG: bifunctional metallophosphatase/5'-nucleotidase, partial [Oscillospiraceae bacterium]|nr:bifunctional metallophosphatase/5'-nucleotidase [Oscillospiraceae bacterium]